MFRKFLLVGALALASLTAACSNPFASKVDVSAPKAAPVAAQAKPQINTVVVRVPSDPVPAPAAAPSIAYPTLPTQAAPPQVTVNPAPVTVQPAAVMVSVDAPKSATAFRVYGDYAIDLFNVLWTAFGGMALVYARKYLAQAPMVVQAGVAMAGGVDSIVQQLHDVAVNSIEGATKGKALDLNVGSKVLATFLQLGLDKGPDFLASVGGLAGLKQKFLAVAHLGDDVSAAKLGIPVPVGTPIVVAAPPAPVQADPAPVAPVVAVTIAPAPVVAAVTADAPPAPANDAAPVAPVPAVA